MVVVVQLMESVMPPGWVAGTEKTAMELVEEDALRVWERTVLVPERVRVTAPVGEPRVAASVTVTVNLLPTVGEPVTAAESCDGSGAT